MDFNDPRTGLREIDEDPNLFKLVVNVLDIACDDIGRTGTQDPLAAIQTPQGIFIQGFKNEKLEMAYDEARRALLAAPLDAERYALTWAAYLTLDGVRYETAMAEGGGRGRARGFRIGQRYKQQLPDVRYQPIGNPVILGPSDNLLTLASDPSAASKLAPVFEKITADIDHDHATGNDKAPCYQLRTCKELILDFGDLELPFRKELQKKPDTVHVIMNGRIWATTFKPDAKDVILVRNTLVPLQGRIDQFPGFNEDGVIIIGYMPPIPTGDHPPATVGILVHWMAEFKITDKERVQV